MCVNGLKINSSIDRAIGAAQCLVSHFRKSEPAMRAFRNRQKAMQTPNHCLIQDEIKAIRQSLEIHQKESDESHNYYTEITKKCSEKWKRTIELERKTDLTADEGDKLVALHNSFTLVITADYQITRLPDVKICS